jgi:hypothetical protein
MQKIIDEIKATIAHAKANWPAGVRRTTIIGHLTEAAQHLEDELKYAEEEAAKAAADLKAAKTGAAPAAPAPAATATKPVKLPE